MLGTQCTQKRPGLRGGQQESHPRVARAPGVRQLPAGWGKGSLACCCIQQGLNSVQLRMEDAFLRGMVGYRFIHEISGDRTQREKKQSMMPSGVAGKNNSDGV